MPRFIEEEFRGFLRCGWLAGGFARFRCAGCGLDRLVPFFVQRILAHLGLATELPRARPARPPPASFDGFDREVDDDIAVR